jgi:hypothetical protein
MDVFHNLTCVVWHDELYLLLAQTALLDNYFQ